MTDSELLVSFVQDLKAHIPKLEVCYKKESRLMRLIGFLLGPINPTFMSMFITALGSKVYFTDRKFVETFPLASASVLAHEFVHMFDEKREGYLKYRHAYLAPQIYGLGTLALFSAVFSVWPLVLLVGGYVGCCFLAKKSRQLSLIGLAFLGASTLGLAWLTSGFLGLLAFLVALVPLAPWPSKGRTRLELRGYAMTIAAHEWLHGTPMPDETRAALLQYFTGPSYYFMSWSPVSLELTLGKAKASSESPQADEPYQIVRGLLLKYGKSTG